MMNMSTMVLVFVLVSTDGEADFLVIIFLADACRLHERVQKLHNL